MRRARGGKRPPREGARDEVHERPTATRRLRRGATALVVALTVAGVVASTAAAEPRSTPDRSSEAAVCADPCFYVIVKVVGSGTVTSTPAGINCGQACNFDFKTLNATSVWLTATPDNFKSWHGCPESHVIDGKPMCLLEAGGAITAYCVIALFDNVDPGPCINSGAGTSPPPPPPPSPPDTNPPPLGSRCTIVGSPRAEVLRGTGRSDVLCGLGGNDRIYGGGGHDLIVGGHGDDKLYGGPGNDRIVGGPGNDLLYGGGGKDILRGGGGADTLYARDGARDVVDGGRGRDRARVDAVDVLRSIATKF